MCSFENIKHMKIRIARLLDLFFITHLFFFLSRKGYGRQHIRVVNYHGTPLDTQANFEKQIRWIKRYYSDVNETDLVNFLNEGKWGKRKPGTIISFDDGLKNNLEVALPVLEKYQFTGWFCVPSGFVNCPGPEQKQFAEQQRISKSFDAQDHIAMKVEEIRKLAERHVILSHTQRHHRMSGDDSSEILDREILQSKEELEQMTEKPVRGFCWVGGEESTYTKDALARIKKAGYEYSFMTNNLSVTTGADPFRIQRTNLESWMPLYLVRFYLSGFYDLFYFSKRRKIDKKLNG